MSRTRLGASILHCGHGALHAAAPPLTTVQKLRITYTVGGAQAQFIRMKSASKKHTPNIVNLTVKRDYLTEREVERPTSMAATGPLQRLLEGMTLGLGHLGAAASGRRQARDDFRFPLDNLGARPGIPLGDQLLNDGERLL